MQSSSEILLPRVRFLHDALLLHGIKDEDMDEIRKTSEELKEIGIHEDSSDDGLQAVGNEGTEDTENTGDT